jgi:hypothetical protein
MGKGARMTCYVCPDCAVPCDQFHCNGRAIELTDKQYECWTADTSLDASDVALWSEIACAEFLKFKQGETI